MSLDPKTNRQQKEAEAVYTPPQELERSPAPFVRTPFDPFFFGVTRDVEITAKGAKSAK